MIKIDTLSEEYRFEQHINIPDNDHIIFSGMFGVGKSYFLNSFFSKRKQEYDVFTISPVHYSIAKNEDILKYIKYDLSFQLLGKPNVEFQKVEYSSTLASQVYLLNNLKEIAGVILKNASSIGKTWDAIYKCTVEIKQNIELLSSGAEVNNKDEIHSFLKEVTNSEGSIFEENQLTQLISLLIESSKSTSKRTILVIEDLDRIDPEHIFRILNVFACHFNLGNDEGNKFGFDKIILVCDLLNIKNIYHSKYGEDVDFTGYIDKYYSHDVFEFDNRANVRKAVLGVFQLIESDRDYFIPKHEQLLKFIVEEMILANALNLRALLKWVGKNYTLREYMIDLKDNKTEPNTRFQIIVIFEFLTSMLGSISNLKSAFIKTRKHSKLIVSNSHLGQILPIFQLIFSDSHDGYVAFESINLSVSFTLTDDRPRGLIATNIETKNISNQNKKGIDIPLIEVVYSAFEIFEKLKKKI